MVMIRQDSLARAQQHWRELPGLDGGLYHVQFDPRRWSKDFLGYIDHVNVWSDRDKGELQGGAQWEFRPLFKVLAWKSPNHPDIHSYEMDKFYLTGGAKLEPVGLDFLPVVLGWEWHGLDVDRLLREGFLPENINREVRCLQDMTRARQPRSTQTHTARPARKSSRSSAASSTSTCWNGNSTRRPRSSPTRWTATD